MTASAPEAPQRTAKPGELLSQWWTMGSLVMDPRITGRHLKAAWVIIDRYMKAHGSGRASVRFISKATGQSSGTIVKACRDLVEWGYMSQRLGIGQHPTEFTPNWISVSPMYNASTDKISVSPLCNTSVSPLCNANDNSVSPVCSESYLQSPADKPADLISSEPGPGAPLVAAANAAPPRAGRDGFEEFWSAYPRQYQRVKAKAAWAKLDSVDHAAIISGAKAYAKHCREAGREARFIKQAANWLTEECWFEDPSAGFTAGKPKRAHKQAKPKASNDNRPANIKGGVTNMPVGEHLVEIVEHKDGDPWAATSAVTIILRPVGGGGPWVHEAYIDHPFEEEWEAGRKSNRSLLYAIGGDANSGVYPDPVGKHVWATVGKAIEYRAAIAPMSAQGASLRSESVL